MTENLIENQNSKDWRVLEFFVPIQESVNEGDNFVIRGVAINETTTLNNVKYVAEELQKAASSFRNVPILLDHKNEVKNIVGRTTENVNWNASTKRIEFEGKIMDKDIQEMIKDGRIGSVSIGAKVNDLVEEEDGSMKALGIHGLELSLVAVPGDTHANLAQALQNSFVLKEKLNLKDDVRQKIKKEDSNMAEEEQKEEVAEEEAKEEVAEEEKEEAKEEVAEEKVAQEINVKVDTSEITEMRKQIDEMKEMLLQKKEVKEAEEVEDETKGEVSEDDEEEDSEEVVVERCDTGRLALYRDYSKDGSSLKRLVR